MNTNMKLKLSAAMIMGIFISGCGGGGSGDGASDAFLAGTSSSSGTSQTGTGQTSTPSSGTTDYLNQAYQAGLSQTQQTQLLSQKLSTSAVQQLAQQLAADATVTNQQINNFTQANNINLSNTLTSNQQARLNDLNALSGTNLEQSYVAGVVSSLKELLASTMRQAREGTDIQVRQAAASNVLLVEQRLTQAEEVLYALQPSAYLAGAYEDSLLEIQLAQVALQKATNEQVRQFAQHMIDEHTQLNTQITPLAQQRNVTLPTSLGPDKQEIVTTVSAFSGADFDKAYMDRNVMTHAEDVRKTSVVAQQGNTSGSTGTGTGTGTGAGTTDNTGNSATSGTTSTATTAQQSSDNEIRTLAAQALPVLQEHLQEAITIANSIQPSAFYQLSQSIVTELQLGQLAQTRTTDTQTASFAQGIASENQSAYAQIVQLSQQNNTPIPLTIPPNLVQTVLQLPRDSSTANSGQVQNLINSQTASSQQVAQSLQSSSEAGIGTLATQRVQTLQARSTRAGQLGQGSGSGSGGGSSGGSGGGSSDSGGGSSGGSGGGSSDSGGDASGNGGSSGSGTSANNASGNGSSGSPGSSGSSGNGSADTPSDVPQNRGNDVPFLDSLGSSENGSSDTPSDAPQNRGNDVPFFNSLGN